MRSRSAVALVLLGGLALAGCAGGSSGRGAAAGRNSGPIRMSLAGVGSLDPARATTAQDTELDWAVYTGLVTYRHASGEAGTELIPGVAVALPKISAGGRLYTFTLRRRLRFSNGHVVTASDVVATFERAISTKDSPVRPLLLPVLDGAAGFAAGDAKSITGVSGDDATGEITIRLRRADPGFEALLAEPALGIVPAGTPVHGRPGHPPPGIGPYRLRDVAPGRSFTLERNPYWTPVPGIPAGEVDVDVMLSKDTTAGALAVLNDVLDVADPTQALSSATLTEIRDQGGSRERLVADGRPAAYLFLDSHQAPFDSRLAREAVIDGMGALTPARAGARTVAAACDVVPEVSDSPTPDGCAPQVIAGGALASARLLVRRSGTAGATVVVWSPRSGPEHDWLSDEASVLSAIGYVTRVVSVSDAIYRDQVTSLVPQPSGQAGNASSVRPVLDRRAVKSAGGPGLERVPAVVEGRLASEVRVPVDDALAVAVGRPRVSLTQARREHTVEFGEPAVTELMSWRMDESATVIDPVEGLDFTSLRLR